ncbi:MAG: STAS/SEC14 domain-containing protein [Campylobacterota bacterium]|nr:STAS/SEC14 domain-containing protein [Campylobacterota bacterium]
MSEYIEHGVSIGISRVGGNFFIKLKIDGTLTHEDYKLMVPMIEDAIKKVEEPKVKILIDAIDFEGWNTEALWDDLKFSLGHIELFEKIAFVGNKKWEEYAIKISNWFMIGDIEYFENMDDAIVWINEEKVLKSPLQKEFDSRENEIKGSLELLFKANMKITAWDVPEVDEQKAAEMLIDMMSKKLFDIKMDVKKGKYSNY